MTDKPHLRLLTARDQLRRAALVAAELRERHERSCRDAVVAVVICVAVVLWAIAWAYV